MNNNNVDSVHSFCDTIGKKPKKEYPLMLFLFFGMLILAFVVITLIVIPIINEKSRSNVVETPLQDDIDKVHGVGEEDNDSEAYHYWYAPPNSFGIQETKSVNFTFWKQWLKTYFSYELEARQDNESSWQNANNLLNVSLNFNELNNTCKVTLTLNTTNAPKALFYKFTLVANRTVINYVNKSVDYEYTLNLAANSTENYSLVYNYSDLKPYIDNDKINIKQGIKNNYFYQRIKTNKKIAVGQEFVIDPTFGYITVGGSSFEYNDDIRGSEGSPTNDCIFNNMSFYGKAASATTTYVILALYDKSDSSLVAESEVINVDSVTPQWWSAIFNTTVYGYSAKNYLCAIAVSGNANTRLYYNAVGGATQPSQNNFGYPNLPDPVSTAVGYQCSVYCNYTNVSATTWQEINSSINGTCTNLTVLQPVNWSINGSCTNITILQPVNYSINGTCTNITVLTPVNFSINGTCTNVTVGATTWQPINYSINGTCTNTTILQPINWSINGSCTNITTLQPVNYSINGSCTNTTILLPVNFSINGTCTNITVLQPINWSTNGTCTNTSVATWQPINYTINGTCTNITGIWQPINYTINGTCTNTSVVPPIIFSNEYPSNTSFNAPLQPYVYLTINSTTGLTMNISWYYGNSQGAEDTLLGTDANITNSTQTELFFQASTRSTPYYWRVMADDGTTFVNDSFYFRTEGLPGGGVSFPPSNIGIIGILGLVFGILLPFIILNQRKKRNQRTDEQQYRRGRY